MSEEKEITLGDVIYNIESEIKYLFSKWKSVFIVSVLVAGLFIVINYVKPSNFTAELTYMVNEDDGSSGPGSISSVLGQFGLNGGSQGKFNLDKIIELSKSRSITTKVLFQEVFIDDQKNFIANHFLNTHKTSISKEIQTAHYFDTVPHKDDVDKNTILKHIHNKLVNPNTSPYPVLTHVYNESSGILTISATSSHQELAIAISKTLFEQLSQYYIEKTIEKQKQTHQVFKRKTDSLETKLKETNYALLQFDDSSRNLSLKQYQARRLNLQAEITKLSAAYTEAYKSLQIAELALENKTPFITMIDDPILPLSSNKGSLVKQAIIGFLIGAFLSVLFLILIRFYNNNKL